MSFSSPQKPPQHPSSSASSLSFPSPTSKLGSFENLNSALDQSMMSKLMNNNNNNSDTKRVKKTSCASSSSASTSRSKTDAAVDFLKLLTSSSSADNNNNNNNNNSSSSSPLMTINQVATLLSVPPFVISSALSSLKSSRLLRRQLRKWILQMSRGGKQGTTNNNIENFTNSNNSTSSATRDYLGNSKNFPRQLALRVVAESNAADALDRQQKRHHQHASGDDDEDDDDLDSMTTSVFSLLDDDVRKHFEVLSRSMGQNFASILNAPPASDHQTEAAARQATATANSWANWIVGGIQNSTTTHHHNDSASSSPSTTTTTNTNSSSSSSYNFFYGMDNASFTQLPSYLSNPGTSAHLINDGNNSSSSSSSSEQLLKQTSRHAAQLASRIADGVMTTTQHHHHQFSNNNNNNTTIPTIGDTATGASTTTSSSSSSLPPFSQDYTTIENYLRDMQLSWKLRREILLNNNNNNNHNNHQQHHQLLLVDVVDQVEQMLEEGKPLIPPSLPKMFYDFSEEENSGNNDDDDDDEENRNNHNQPNFFNMKAIIESAFPHPVVLGFRKMTEKELEEEQQQNKSSSSVKKKRRTNNKSNNDASLAHDEVDEVVMLDPKLSDIAKVEEEDCSTSTETVAALENCLETVKAWLMCYVHRKSREFYEASKTFDDLSREAREALVVGDSAFDDVSTAGSSLTGSMVQLAQLQRRRQNLSATLEMLERMEKFRRKSISVLASSSTTISQKEDHHHHEHLHHHLQQHSIQSDNSSSVKNNDDPLRTTKHLSKIQSYLVTHPEFNSASSSSQQQISTSMNRSNNNNTNNNNNTLRCFAPIIRRLNAKRSLLRGQLPSRAASHWSLLLYSNNDNDDRTNNDGGDHSLSSSSSSLEYWQRSNDFLEASVELGCLSACLTAYRERTVVDFATRVLQNLLKFVMDHASTHTPYQQQQTTTTIPEQHCVNAYREFVGIHQLQQQKVQQQQQQQQQSSSSSTSKTPSSSNHRLSGPAFRTAMARIVQLCSFVKTSPDPHKSVVAIVADVLDQVFSNLLPTCIRHTNTLYERFLSALPSFTAFHNKEQHRSLQQQIIRHSMDLKSEHLCNLRDVCLLSVAAISESYPLVYTPPTGNNSNKSSSSRFPTSIEFNIIQTMNGLLQLSGEKLVEAFESQNNNNTKTIINIEVQEQADQLKSLGTNLVKNCFKSFHNKMFEKLLTIIQNEDWSFVEKVPSEIQKEIDYVFCGNQNEGKGETKRHIRGNNTKQSSSSTFHDLVEHYSYDLCDDNDKPQQEVFDDNINGGISGIKIGVNKNSNHSCQFHLVTQSVLTLFKMLTEYRKYENEFGEGDGASSINLNFIETVASRVGILLKVFDGQCTALVLGGGAAECGTVQAISWSHLATASVDLKVVSMIAECWVERLSRFINAAAVSSPSSSTTTTILNDLKRVKSDVSAHRLNLLQKIISTLSENIEQSVFKSAPTATVIMTTTSSSSGEGSSSSNIVGGQKAESNWLLQLLKKVAMMRKVTRSCFGVNSDEEKRLTIQALYVVALFVRKHFVTLAAGATTNSNQTSSSSSSSSSPEVVVVKQAARYLTPLLRANIRNFKFAAVAVLRYGNETLSQDDDENSTSSNLKRFEISEDDPPSKDSEEELEKLLTSNIRYGGSSTPTPPPPPQQQQQQQKLSSTSTTPTVRTPTTTTATAAQK